MKIPTKVRLLSLGAALMALQGCVIYSLEPFYVPEDVWPNIEAMGRWNQKTDGKEASYLFETREEHLEDGVPQYLVTENKGKADETKYVATFFKKDGVLFADLKSGDSGDKAPITLPVHLLMKVEQSRSEMSFVCIDQGWLDKASEKPKFSGRLFGAEFRRSQDFPVLVCPSKEIREFVAKVAATPEAWSKKFKIVLMREEEPTEVPTETKK
jgi:hypothetical protein